MAISDADKRNLSARINAILVEEIHGQFLDLYASAVSLTEKHPEQVNNELRNAMTHMSRAASADNIEAAYNELDAAERHIERAKRDAIKIGVIKLRDLIADACEDIKIYRGTLEPAFVIRRDGVHKERQEIVKEEAKGGNVINSYAALYLKAGSLYDDLLSELGRFSSLAPKWRYRWIRWRRGLIGFVTGVAGILQIAPFD